MTTPIRGLLFDKDGTLLDFARTWPPAYRAAAEHVAAAAGEPGLAARVLRRTGWRDDGTIEATSLLACGTNADIAAAWAEEPALAALDDLAARLDAVFLAHALVAPALVPDLAAWTAALVGRGFALGMATNDSTAAAKGWLTHHGADRHFAFIAGADGPHGAKPAPTLMEAFCAAAGGLEPANVAVIGDSGEDTAFARAAGAGLAVLVLSGVAQSTTPAPDRVIGSVLELDRVLATLPTA